MPTITEPTETRATFDIEKVTGLWDGGGNTIVVYLGPHAVHLTYSTRELAAAAYETLDDVLIREPNRSIMCV